MKTLRPLIFSLSLFGFIIMGVDGQEAAKKVHLKVVKGGETTVDTVFSASDLGDEDLHKKISELSGVDIEMIHGEEMSIHAGHKEHSGHKEAHSYSYVTVDDDEVSEGEVNKKIIHGKGEHYKIQEIDEDHKGHVKVIKVKKGEGDSEEVTVTVITDDELHMDHKHKGDVNVVVSESESGTVIVKKEVEVVKSIDEGGEVIEITVVIDEGEKEKQKEKSDKTKQKKEKERNKK